MDGDSDSVDVAVQQSESENGVAVKKRKLS